jgi:hypothetical protein
MKFQVGNYYVAHSPKYSAKILVTRRDENMIYYRYICDKTYAPIDSLMVADGPGLDDWDFDDSERSSTVSNLRIETILDVGEEESLKFAADVDA